MSDITVTRGGPWWASPRQDSMFLEVRCGSAYACVFLPPDGRWNIDLGYKDEEACLPICTSPEELADWARLTNWLARQPWPKWDDPERASALDEDGRPVDQDGVEFGDNCVTNSTCRASDRCLGTCKLF